MHDIPPLSTKQPLSPDAAALHHCIGLRHDKQTAASQDGGHKDDPVVSDNNKVLF